MKQAYRVYKGLVAFSVGYTFFQCVARPWRLEDNSMEPTFKDGQIVLSTSLNSKLQTGDIIIAKDPFNPCQRICKRVIGLPGHVVHHNGIDLPIPNGKMWLEGDNKGASLDSRSFGPIPIGLMEGIVFCRLKPFTDFRISQN